MESAKLLSRALRKNSCWASACMIRRVSSAYWIIGNYSSLCGIGAFSRFMEAALFTIIWSKSTAKTNRSGDNGSPCRTPRLHWNFLPGTPLRMTDEFPVDKIVLIHEIHLLGKPIRLRICVMATCSTVSNAFSKSSLRMIASLLQCLHWCMYSKLHAR